MPIVATEDIPSSVGIRIALERGQSSYPHGAPFPDTFPMEFLRDLKPSPPEAWLKLY